MRFAGSGFSHSKLKFLKSLFLVLASASWANEPANIRVEDYEIKASLTGQSGIPERGERIVRDADNATCLICHSIPIADAPDPGDIGPPLEGVGSRYSAGELRLRLVDPKALNPDTVMPSYFKIDGLQGVAPEYRGRPIYSAQDIEDVVAFLLTLVEE
ncbi:MAG: sulfur oxidation c-type cytochrome SoxX [Albidovulum sp.]|nr:sulfur oxidation c-type cytochrome SoxX [Albidovulum sp.]